jgi:hypothetical protein
MKTKLKGRKNKCALFPYTLYGDEKSAMTAHYDIV